MTTERYSYKQGILNDGPMVSIVAAATPVTLYTLAAGRTAIIRKLMVMNRNAANVVVQIGTGLAGLFVQAIPGITCFGSLDLQLGDDSLPSVEFNASITVQATGGGAAAPNDIQVLVEVEEFVGVNG